MKHGHVIPNPNGVTARCGGPGICPQCSAEKAQLMQKPSVGRIVHYVLPDGPSAGQVRPAIIVRTWGDTPESVVQLQVFADGNGSPANDGTPNVVWKTSVHQSEGPEAGKFHFPVITR